jgi:hypothetical protein
VGPDNRKPDQLPLKEERYVDADIVEVLSAYRLMVSDHDVPRPEIVGADLLHTILNNHSKICDKVRDPSHVLREQAPLTIQEGTTIIPHLINHHVVRSPL